MKKETYRNTNLNEIVKAIPCSITDPKDFAIFDMDGTLIDSMKYWHNLGLECLRSYGVTADVSSTLEEVVTMTTSESSALFVERFSLAASPKELEDEMTQTMAGHYKNDIPLKSRTLPYLRWLRSKGVRMCVASATAEPLMKDCLARLGILDMFEFALSCETLGTDKSEPVIFLEAAKRFGAYPQEVSVYEDALHAMKTAGKSGFHVVAVYDDEAAENWDESRRIADEWINLD